VHDPGQRGSSLATVFGIAGVVAVFVAVLSIGEGWGHCAGRRPATAVRSGSDSRYDVSSTRRSRSSRRRRAWRAGDRRRRRPLSSAVVRHRRPAEPCRKPANVPLRGVQPAAFATRPELTITNGRKFEWGKNEVIVGEGAQKQFRGLDVGSKVKWGQNVWTVVGAFSANGAVWESEIWTDARVLQPAYRRGNSFQTVIARLESPEAFYRFKDALTRTPSRRPGSEGERVLRKPGPHARIIRGSASLVAHGIGAVFGAEHDVQRGRGRTREMATLRA
jgi:putative ABC transport system permease protein